MGHWSENNKRHRSERKTRRDARSTSENKKRLARLAEIEQDSRKMTQQEIETLSNDTELAATLEKRKEAKA